MAHIGSRINKDGSETWRVVIRRKGCPVFCLSFTSSQEAKKWAKENERKYIHNPISYIDWINQERLNLRRDREDSR